MAVSVVSFPRGALGWSAVCDCGISWSYSLTFLSFHEMYNNRIEIVSRQFVFNFKFQNTSDNLHNF